MIGRPQGEQGRPDQLVRRGLGRSGSRATRPPSRPLSHPATGLSVPYLACGHTTRELRARRGTVAGVRRRWSRCHARAELRSARLAAHFTFGPDDLRCGWCSKALPAYPRWPIEHTAPLAERRPIGDSTALTAPCQMPPARAGDAADQHPPRPQRAGIAAVAGRSIARSWSAPARRPQPCSNARRCRRVRVVSVPSPSRSYTGSADVQSSSFSIVAWLRGRGAFFAKD